MKQYDKNILESIKKAGTKSRWGALSLFASAMLIQTVGNASADVGESLTQSMTTQKSTWSLIKENLRVRTFTEVMSPPLSGSRTSVPLPNGQDYLPSNMFHIVWMDYPIAKNLRVLYWQRMLMFLSANASPNFQSQFQFVPREPRFALRWVDGFNVPHLNTTYDLYVQPGVTKNFVASGNHYDIGFRTSTAYSIPKSKWSVGLVQEYTVGGFDPKGKGPRAWGWFMPWASYEINQKFSTQHVMYYGIRNDRKNKVFQYEWDDAGMPYIQNGVGFNVSKSVQLTALVNNYLAVRPSLKNTWTSLWLSMNIL